MGSRTPTTYLTFNLRRNAASCCVHTARDNDTGSREPVQAGFQGRGAVYPSYLGARATKMEVPPGPDKQGESRQGRWQFPTTLPANLCRKGSNLGSLRLQPGLLLGPQMLHVLLALPVLQALFSLFGLFVSGFSEGIQAESLLRDTQIKEARI